MLQQVKYCKYSIYCASVIRNGKFGVEKSATQEQQQKKKT